MNKIIILFLALTAVVLTTGCSDDDESGASLQGNWKLTAEKEGNDTYVLDACELEQTISFASTTGNLSVLDDDTPPCTYETVPFAYSVSGSNITFNVTGPFPVAVQGIIEELSSTTLRFRIVSDSENGVYPQDDIITQTYRRQ